MPRVPPPPLAPPQRTVAVAFAREGIGVHTGERGRAEVRPAPFGTGLVFTRGADRVPATIDHVVAADGSTTLGGAFRIGMVEHLLAALFAQGVTDATIEVEGPEVPILDGSALPWVEALAAAGTIDGPPAKVLVITRPIAFETQDGQARVEPSDRFEATVEVDYGPNPNWPHGRASWAGDRFAQDIAWARTYVLERDIDRLVGMGRGKGATPENTVVYGDDGPKLPERGPQEAVKHRLLDLLGDLALLGLPLRGSFHVSRGSHRMDHALIRHALGLRDSWALFFS